MSSIVRGSMEGKQLLLHLIVGEKLYKAGSFPFARKLARASSHDRVEYRVWREPTIPSLSMMAVRDTSELGLAPPITSAFRSQNGVIQCVHAGYIYIKCYIHLYQMLHVLEKTTDANPKLEKTTDNLERQFLKKNVPDFFLLF